MSLKAIYVCITLSFICFSVGKCSSADKKETHSKAQKTFIAALMDALRSIANSSLGDDPSDLRIYESCYIGNCWHRCWSPQEPESKKLWCYTTNNPSTTIKPFIKCSKTDEFKNYSRCAHTCGETPSMK
jgi:hypothetical protein